MSEALAGLLRTLSPGEPVHRLLSVVLRGDGPAEATLLGGSLPEVPALGAPGERALRAAALLDHGPHFSGPASAPRAALDLFEAHEEWASGIEELERGHARDVAQRMAGLALCAEALFTGAPQARVQQLRDHPAGRAALTWIAAIEVALAFTSWDELPRDWAPTAILSAHGDPGPFAALVGDDAAHQGVLQALAQALDVTAAQCADIAKVLAEGMRDTLPPLDAPSREELQDEARRSPVLGALCAWLIADLGGTGVAEAPAARTEDPRAPLQAARREQAAAVDDLRARVDALQQRRGALAEPLAQAEARHGALRARRPAATPPEAEALIAALAEAQARLGQAERSLSALAQRRAQAERALAQARSEQATGGAGGDPADAEQHHAAAQQRLDAARQQVRDTLLAIFATRDKLTRVSRARLGGLAATREHTRSALAELRARPDAPKVSAAPTPSRVETGPARARLAEAEAALASTRQPLERARARLAEAETARDSVRARHDALEQAHDRAAQALRSAEEAVPLLRLRASAAATQLRSLRERPASVAALARDWLAREVEERDALRARREALVAARPAPVVVDEAAIPAAKAAAQEARGARDAARAALERLGERLQEARGALDRAAAIQADATARLRGAADRRAQAERAQTEVRGRLLTRLNAEQALEEQVLTLRTALQGAVAARRAALEQEQADARRAAATLKQDLKQRHDLMRQTQETLSQRQQARGALGPPPPVEDRRDALREALGGQRAALSQSTASRDGLRQQADEAAAELARVEVSRDTARVRFEGLPAPEPSLAPAERLGQAQGALREAERMVLQGRVAVAGAALAEQGAKRDATRQSLAMLQERRTRVGADALPLPDPTEVRGRLDAARAALSQGDANLETLSHEHATTRAEVETLRSNMPEVRSLLIARRAARWRLAKALRRRAHRLGEARAANAAAQVTLVALRATLPPPPMLTPEVSPQQAREQLEEAELHLALHAEAVLEGEEAVQAAVASVPVARAKVRQALNLLRARRWRLAKALRRRRHTLQRLQSIGPGAREALVLRRAGIEPVEGPTEAELVQLDALSSAREALSKQATALSHLKQARDASAAALVEAEAACFERESGVGDAEQALTFARELRDSAKELLPQRREQVRQAELQVKQARKAVAGWAGQRATALRARRAEAVRQRDAARGRLTDLRTRRAAHPQRVVAARDDLARRRRQAAADVEGLRRIEQRRGALRASISRRRAVLERAAPHLVIEDAERRLDARWARFEAQERELVDNAQRVKQMRARRDEMREDLKRREAAIEALREAMKEPEEPVTEPIPLDPREALRQQLRQQMRQDRERRRRPPEAPPEPVVTEPPSAPPRRGPRRARRSAPPPPEEDAAKTVLLSREELAKQREALLGEEDEPSDESWTWGPLDE